MSNSVNALKLLQVQVFYRHGARTPLHLVRSKACEATWSTSTTVDVKETVIPYATVDLRTDEVDQLGGLDSQYIPWHLPGGESIGMLTSQGQLDTFNLGKRLRENYVENESLLSLPIIHSEIFARSTRIGRNLKSTRCVLAGLLGEVQSPFKVRTLPLEQEILFPNPMLCSVLQMMFQLGNDENIKLPEIISFKEKLRKCIGTNQLIDVYDPQPNSTADCPIYYVRDDYVARQHNGFPIPPGMEQLLPDMHRLSAREIMAETLGREQDWKTNIDLAIGPIIHLVLNNMENCTDVPRLHAFAVHDSTLLPLLLALDVKNITWPPFNADLIFELYEEVGTLAKANSCNKLWIQVKYLAEPIPLATLWKVCHSDVCRPSPGEPSTSLVPFKELLNRWSHFALPVADYPRACRMAAERLQSQEKAATVCGRSGPKAI